jgi:hypothetical protein
MERVTSSRSGNHEYDEAPRKSDTLKAQRDRLQSPDLTQEITNLTFACNTMTFLQHVAKHILTTHDSDLARTVIVVPTRRAAFFMMQELAFATTAPMISPSVVAIDDFLEGISTWAVEDPVHLMLELYESFLTVDEHLSFDRFMGWASVLLSDLDKIDQYLINTDQLFSYLSESQALDRWQEQLAPGKKLNTLVASRQYFHLFENINKVYQTFRSRLASKGKAYRGMIYRQVAEEIDTLFATKSDFSKIYFAGFNAFTESEKLLVAELCKKGKAEVLWDTDSYYMSINPGIEAGKSLREYKKSGFGGDWKWTEDHLTKSSKEIFVYGVPNAVLQTKVAGQLYAEMTERDRGKKPVMTAIVLADENLLLPMIYSLDESINDFNITMGLSLRSSLLYTLVDSLFELQQNVVEFRSKSGKQIRIPKFNHKSVDKVLNHPFIRHYEHVVLRAGSTGTTIIQNLLSEINEKNLVFLSSEDIVGSSDHAPLFRILFRHWDKRNPRTVLDTFYQLIDLLRDVYKDYKNALETEYLYLFYTLLKQFEQTLDDQPGKISLRTLQSFMYELIRQTKIPFSGEPVSNLQILGMLETRALDFDRLIILSVNEGILPQAKRQNSLIPFDAAQAVGLPTHQHQEAVMSYHFYRLLQRASEVHLLYTNTNDAPGGGEKSRFIQQIEFELARYNPGIRIKNKIVVSPSSVSQVDEEVVEKNDAMIAAIRKHLGGKGIYPTHLNELIRCSMQFYLKHVVGVEEKEEVEEELGMDKIGTWLHACLERLDVEFFLKDQDPDDEQIKHVLREEFDRLFKGYVTDLGLNRVYFQVGEQQILTFIHHQLKQTPRRTILAAEQSLRTTVNLFLQGSDTPVNLGGKIDRIELSEDGTLYVMDYKTGSVDTGGKQKFADPIKMEELLRTDSDIKTGYIRQLWLYEFLMYRKMQDGSGLQLKDHKYGSDDFTVKSGFYSFRDPKNAVMNPLEFNDVIDAQAFLAKSETILSDILNDLLDRDKPFKKTKKLEICSYCDFRGICGR